MVKQHKSNRVRSVKNNIHKLEKFYTPTKMMTIKKESVKKKNIYNRDSPNLFITKIPNAPQMEIQTRHRSAAILQCIYTFHVAA